VNRVCQGFGPKKKAQQTCESAKEHLRARNAKGRVICPTKFAILKQIPLKMTLNLKFKVSTTCLKGFSSKINATNLQDHKGIPEKTRE
jgi:hypothetical protein